MLLASVEHLLKETGEAALRTALQSLQRMPEHDLADALEKLRETGCSAVPDFWSAEQCAAARAQVDSLIEAGSPGHHWRDELGSDKRVFFAERACGSFEIFYKNSKIESLRCAYTGFAKSQKLVLAARLDYVPDNVGSGNGWHRDSPHRAQFKAIMYLNDCSAENGPFQYIPGSHKAVDSISLMFNGGSRPNQYRFTNKEIDRLIDAGRTVDTWTGDAGTLLLVDTKGLHRGSPILAGVRYAMTLYAFDRSMPKDFLS